MTSAAVTQSNGSIMNLAVQNTAVRTDGSEAGFTKVMDSVSKSQSRENVSEKEKSSFKEAGKDQTQDRVNGTDKKDPYHKHDVAADKAQESSGAEVSKTETSASEDGKEVPLNQAEDAVEAGEEAVSTQMYQSLIEQAADLIEQTADCFSVGTEDVMEAMKQLDMNMTDILKPEKMQELALALTGEDQTALLTDEDLYQSVQELIQLSADATENLQKTLGIDQEDLNGLLEQAAKAEGLQEMSQGTLTEAGNATVEIVSDEMPEVQGTQDMKTPVYEKGEMQNGQTDQEVSVQKVGQQTAVTSGEAEETSEEMQEDANAENGSQLNFADTMQNPVNELFENSVKEGSMTESKVDTEQIMKQIMDHMKIRNSEQLSEIEMQLHPASLGSLHISVASKNGLVTAQFAAQNEAVKEALEGQIMILKDHLEQQGVRVEAVEVTIASHEFERNLEQEAKQNEQEAQRTEARKKGIRRIDLNNPEEEEPEETDEAERITRDMMMRHGSRLDYLA